MRDSTPGKSTPSAYPVPSDQTSENKKRKIPSFKGMVIVWRKWVGGCRVCDPRVLRKRSQKPHPQSRHHRDFRKQFGYFWRPFDL